MTEASPVVALQRFSSLRFWSGKRCRKAAGSCGQPLLGVSLEIEGAESDNGEIVVSGANVGLSYFGPRRALRPRAANGCTRGILAAWTETEVFTSVDEAV